MMKKDQKKKKDWQFEAKKQSVYLITAFLLAFGSYTTLGLAMGTDTPVVSVISPSMVPVFDRGDILIVQGVPYAQLKVGDVIVFDVKEEPVPIVHRIVEKNSQYVATKGDANNGQIPFEKRITPEQIKGKMIFMIPFIGHVKLIITDLYSYALGQAPIR